MINKSCVWDVIKVKLSDFKFIRYVKNHVRLAIELTWQFHGFL